METATTEKPVIKSVSAATGPFSFLTIPETTLPNGHVEPAFQVGQYLCSKGADGKAEITASGLPWTEISYHEARNACADIGGSLITETQALVIAYLISQVPENYIDGNLMQGLHSDLGDFDEAMPASLASEADSECRAFLLPDGSFIFDAAGNAYTWVFDNVQGDANGIVIRAFAADSPSITTAPHPSRTKGVGYYPSAGSDWSGFALIRGGCWYSDGYAGVFFLYYDRPGLAGDLVGVRCTKPVGL